MSAWDVYTAQADYQPFRPFMGLNDPAVAGLRAFMRYSPNARVETVDAGGVLKWVTQKQSRIMAVLMRDAGKPGLKMRLIAEETRTCPSTVSRALLKFQAWGLFAIDIRRGRNGGITVWRVVGDTFRDYARRAQIKIRALKAKALNVASTHKEGSRSALKVAYDESRNTLRKVLSTLDATFSEMEAELARMRQPK